MSPDLHLAALLGFAGLMAAAAIEDARRLVIPNLVVAALCALWPLYYTTLAGAGWVAALADVSCAAAVFLAGAVMFARGMIGGGDVKLLSAATLWTGADRVVPLLVVTGAIGGVLALFCLSRLGARVAEWRRGAANPPAALAGAGGGIPVPYGMAIAAAALIVTLAPSVD